MDKQILITTANSLFADHKGLLAMDESINTCNKRFAALGIPPTVEMRRSYREMLMTTPGLNESISGAILFDETIRQQKADGTPFIKVLLDASIIPGIKVDIGTQPLAGFPGEQVTEGLDGLRIRLVEYREMGARFAKWRAVFTIGRRIPSKGAIVANAHALARYAALCQEVGLVPIVEPEVMMTGVHSLGKCLKVTTEILQCVFDQLSQQHVLLEGMILKPNMILSGLDAVHQESIAKVTETTIACFLKEVPAAVPGIAFLSGGQSPEQATAHLAAMNKMYSTKIPWQLSFSFGRALQQPALEIWKGKDENRIAAQQALYLRTVLNRAACKGQFSSSTT